ncbi:MAG: hypothetical protein HN488_03595 [Saprospiraceae bacterium]|jgi:hypothetical protein|nr:hypothetical protein [Saprospiraceae bacterium]
MALARGLSTIQSKRYVSKINKARLKELELEWRKHNKFMKQKGMHDLRYDNFSDYLDYCFGKIKLKTTFQPYEAKETYRRQDNSDKYPSAAMTKPTKAIDNSWKAEESKNFTVAPAYNKGAYQVIPRTDVQHIGK